MGLLARKQTPPFFLSYQKYKPYLRIDFNYRCAYCTMHEAEGGGSKKFHIDHYLPKSLFPAKQSEYVNLLYACMQCNLLKVNYYGNWLAKIYFKSMSS
jgi:5-methylcytosine-specific restriction endonuclease McrA